ncbi:hypothetical protein ABTY96_46785 [Streptomyces sp. NPDC096057]|uniref:hypothetical protein n=1 Tax=Streptomyces sp. NPDC096057 TaxID=3155543 RepID=UPI00332A783E
MKQILKRIGAAAASAITALAVLLIAGTPAAASNPGESHSWSPELANNQLITSSDSVDEDRDWHNGNLVEVWHSNTDNSIYVALNHSTPVQLPVAQTYAAPRIAYFAGHFYVFHTGTNGVIYWQQVIFASSGQLAASQPNAWAALPNSAVTRNNLSPSAIGFPREHDNQALISWGSATDDLQYTMFFNGNSWETPEVVPYVRSATANTLAWNDIYDEITLTHRGSDGQAYISYQPYGYEGWSTPEQLPSAPVTGTPSVAWASNGQGTIAINSGGSVLIDHLDGQGHHDGGWTFENTAFPAGTNPRLVPAGLTIILIMTRRDTHGVYYKPVTLFSG